VAVERLAGVVSQRIAVLDGLQADLDDVRRRQSDEVRSLTAELDTARRSRTETESGLEVARERVQKADLEANEVALRLETAVEALRRDLGVEPKVAEVAEPPEVP
jgi:chromosome segregation ATPase